LSHFWQIAVFVKDVLAALCTVAVGGNEVIRQY